MRVTIDRQVTLLGKVKTAYEEAISRYANEPDNKKTIHLNVRILNAAGQPIKTGGRDLPAPNEAGVSTLAAPINLDFDLPWKEIGKVELVLTVPCRVKYRIFKHKLGSRTFKLDTGTGLDVAYDFMSLGTTAFEVKIKQEVTVAEKVSAAVRACRSVMGGQDGVALVDEGPIHALVAMFAPRIDLLALADLDNIQTKLTALGNRLATAKTEFFDKYGPEDDDDAGVRSIKIFMVPEYYFRKNAWDATPTSLTATEKGTVVTGLQNLSADDDYKDVLILAGTILHHSDDDQDVNVATAQNIAQNQDHFNDTVSQNGRLVKNEAPILYDGGVHTWGRKHRDQKELPDAERATHRYEYSVADTDSVCQFDFPGDDPPGIKCCAEICQDHSTALLKGVKGGTRDRHLQFILSAGARLQATATVTTDKGLVFRCDGVSIECARERGDMPQYERNRFNDRKDALKTRLTGGAPPFAGRVKVGEGSVTTDNIAPVAINDGQDLAYFEASLPAIAEDE